MSKEKTITLTEQELFNLILDTNTEIKQLGTTGVVSIGEVISSKIKELNNE